MQAGYLTPPFVVMSMTDYDIPEETRQKMVIRRRTADILAFKTGNTVAIIGNSKTLYRTLML